MKKAYFLLSLLLSFPVLSILASPDRIANDSGPSGFSIFIAIVILVGAFFVIGYGVCHDFFHGEAGKGDLKGCGLMLVIAIVVVLVVAVQCS